MRTLILAAGAMNRWKNHTGVPKHLVDVDGEPLLHRTVRQFSAFSDVAIVARDGRPGYDLPGVFTEYVTPNPDMMQADRFVSSRHMWTDDTMILAFGDVWFSDRCIRKIQQAAEGDEWAWVARIQPNRYTGCTHGEGFAFVVQPQHHQGFWEAVDLAVALRRRVKIRETVPRGWAVWELFEGALPKLPKERVPRPHYVEVHDWTDDFDHPKDYDRWVARRRRR